MKSYFYATAMALCSTAAVAAPEDDYVIFKTAAAINQQCGGLKYLEHIRTLGAAARALEMTTEEAHSRDGRMSTEDYDRWRAALDARVANEISTVGCTQLAAQYLTWGRGVASEEIYRGLVLAAHLSGLDPEDPSYLAVTPDRLDAMNRYDGYLQALYAENFPKFSTRQKERAAQELPPATSYSALGFALMMDEDGIAKISNAKSLAETAVDAVFFEVAAESAGFLVRPLVINDTWTIPELRPASTVQVPGEPVVDGPGYDLIDLTPNDGDNSYERLYRIVTLRAGNRLRVQYYGAAAARLLNGTVRLYVRDAPPPEGEKSYAFFRTPAFRDGATAYEGVRSPVGCLTPACFDFPPEATEPFIASTGNEFAEIFVSPLPGADGDIGDPSFRPGRISNFYAYRLLKGSEE